MKAETGEQRTKADHEAQTGQQSQGIYLFLQKSSSIIQFYEEKTFPTAPFMFSTAT